jgi:hypothetical protein
VSSGPFRFGECGLVFYFGAAVFALGRGKFGPINPSTLLLVSPDFPSCIALPRRLIVLESRP